MLIDFRAHEPLHTNLHNNNELYMYVFALMRALWLNDFFMLKLKLQQQYSLGSKKQFSRYCTCFLFINHWNLV
jgi:hypothetical protein